MTVDEKRKKLCDYCNDTPCILCKLRGHWCDSYNFDSCSESALDEALELIGESTDNVNNPSHYTHGMECIDEMVLIFGIEATMHFCLLNAWKYRKRALHKNGQEDLDKSDWYINKYKELKEMLEDEHGR